MGQAPTIRVIGFRTEYKTTADGKPRPIEWVEYAPISSIMTNRIVERVSALVPPEHIEGDDEGKKMAFLRHRWSMIQPAYDAWKSGQDIPLNGTPLAAWAGLSHDQTAALQRLGIKTVEEVAQMTDGTISKIPLPNPREMRKQAQLYLESTDRAVAAQEMEARDAKIAALEEQLAAAMELLEQNAGKNSTRAKLAKADTEEAA